MKKKFTLLITAMALLLGNGGMAWGQVQMDCKNAFGAGESRYNDATRATQPITSDTDGALVLDGSVSPTGNPTNSIILGGRNNVVGEYWTGSGTNVANCNGVSFSGTSHGNCTGASKHAPSLFYGCDKTFFQNRNGGFCSATGANNATSQLYTTTGPATIVHVNAGSWGHIEGKANTGNMETPAFDVNYFYFKDIPFTWYTYTRVNGTMHSGTCGTGSSGNYYDASYNTSSTGGHVDGEILVNAGSHIHLRNDINADAGNNSKATLTLPNTAYSLMVDGTIYANNINNQKSGTITNLNPIGVDAVLGVNTGFTKGSTNSAISTPIAGGTILLGLNTTGQADMVITPTNSSTPNANSWSGDSVYTGTPIGANGTANVGNYGANSVNLYASDDMFSSVGTSALQIYNRAGCSYDLNFITNPVAIAINNTGDLFLDSYGLTYFNVANTFNATSVTSDAGDTWIRGAKGVTFNSGAHRYTSTDGSTTGGYYKVEATANGCTPGDIITKLAAPVFVTQNRKIASATLDWWAANNIETGGNVFFANNTGALATTKWYAGNNIITKEGVYFTHSGLGSTHWNAVNSILSKDTVIFNHSAATSMQTNGNWITLQADQGNILMDKKVNFIMANDSSINVLAENITLGTANGNISFFDSMAIVRTNDNGIQSATNIIAGNNIYTAMFTFDSKNKAGDNTNVISHMGDVWLGYNNNTAVAAQALPHGTISTPHTQLSYDLNIFKYNIPEITTGGKLLIRSGDKDPGETAQSNGGNIYFTHIDEQLAVGGLYNTEVSIPFSNWYNCNQGWDTNADYEMAGIIGGVARCQINVTTPTPAYQCTDTGLIYRGFNGELLFDAGTRGNIIINNGARLTFQSGNGNAKFLTRWGDIDMRYPFDVDSMQGSLLFLANSELQNKLNTGNCGCEEKRNNVYLQDFKYNPIKESGSIFIGADNNIKLQYGGLVGSAWNTDQRDPFYSGGAGYRCGDSFHCNSDTLVNKARNLILNFSSNNGVTIDKGGFAAVASDLIDIYKKMEYNGGQGSGMSTVPGYGTLHGESVAGYGLYIKTQANKRNWDHNAFGSEINACWPPKCDDTCSYSILQNVARVTFHSDARINAENQRVYIGSPVFETYGYLDLNTHDKKAGKTSITIQTDSLIVHDSLIIDGQLTNFTTWSGLYRDMPIVKLGHHRFTPPAAEDGCKPCFYHVKETGTNAKRSALDTLYVTFRHGATMKRLHTLIADHTVLSFLTDSFDHVKGDPTINAKFYTDTFKVRNHVELYTDAKHERDGHFELISEVQMDSKDYAGIYARHLHMEPIAPGCGDGFKYSQLWLQDPALDVITTTTFGGYGWIHADVHVEIGATLAPGYASLRDNGDYCYELKAGTLKMQDLRLDKGAQIRYSIGDFGGNIDDEKADCIEVDELTMYGSVDVIIEQRCGQKFEEGCYPIIRYNSVAVDTVNLHNLKLKTQKLDGYRLSLDMSVPGVVYLCVGETSIPKLLREVHIPETEGVVTDPGYGKHYVVSQQDFKFKAKYSTEKPLKVMTDRLVEGKEEELVCKLNENGEYEYVIRRVTQNIVLTIGPDFASVDNASIDGREVWSHNNTIYIRVEKEDIASIYSVAGQMVKRIELSEGSTPVPMERGVYIVTLKDGSVHKVIVK